MKSKKSKVAVIFTIVCFVVLITLGFVGQQYTFITAVVALCACVGAIVGLALLKERK